MNDDIRESIDKLAKLNIKIIETKATVANFQSNVSSAQFEVDKHTKYLSEYKAQLKREEQSLEEQLEILFKALAHSKAVKVIEEIKEKVLESETLELGREA